MNSSGVFYKSGKTGCDTCLAALDAYFQYESLFVTIPSLFPRINVAVKLEAENNRRKFHRIRFGLENIIHWQNVRTVVMNFWVSLEHQIRYKNDLSEVRQLADEAKECAYTNSTDRWMRDLRKRISNNK